MTKIKTADNPRLRRIAVLLGTSLGWREKVMRGIAGYAHEHGPWHVYTAPEGTEDSLFFSSSYKWDGLIVRVTSSRFSRRILALGVPAVSVGSVKVHSPKLPRVKVDDEKLLRPAVRHLLAGGLRNFAYCSFFGTRSAEDRGPIFARLVAEQGGTCAFHSDSCKLPPGAAWQARQRELVRWVKGLEKPVGILCWNPDTACHVVEACHIAGVKVPDEAAVVAADDDKPKCELCSPTVTGVEIPAGRLGYEAAALLDRMMNGEPPPAEGAVMVEPSGVVTVRESSDLSHLQDRDVHRAVRFMRDRAGEPITIADVVEHLQVSRRWLERHFRRVLNRSPHDELHAARLELAKRLLLETDLPAVKVARSAGFGSAPYLNQIFRRETGLTPGAFRRRFRIE